MSVTKTMLFSLQTFMSYKEFVLINYGNELLCKTRTHRRRNRSKSGTARGLKGRKTRPKAESGVGFGGGGSIGIAASHQLGSLGERCRLPSGVRGSPGQIPGRKRIWCMHIWRKTLFGEGWGRKIRYFHTKLIFTKADLGTVFNVDTQSYYPLLSINWLKN